MSPSRTVRIGGAVALALGLVAASPAYSAPGAGDWTMSGYDNSNTRYNPAERTIGVGNVGRLGVKWRLPTAGDVSATPAVEAGTVYVPDFAGNLYAVDAATGVPRWTVNIATLTGIPGDHARATPAIAGDTLIIGDQAGKAFSPDGWLLGIDKFTGALRWKTKLEGGYPIVTQAATVHDGVAYVGLASYEEALVRFGLPLTFRGSMLAVDTATGAIRWQTYMVPDGYTGGAIWGSSPAVDAGRGQVYIATGNNYSVPDSVTACIAGAADDAARAACVAADNLFDSIVAMDLRTGAVRWAFKALPTDAWNLSCGIYFIPGLEDVLPGCPEDAGPDFDFGQGPALYRAASASGKKLDYVGAGQKSGVFWALDPGTGAVRWSTQAGVGGLAGGLQWGSATDGDRVYTANSNSEFKEWVLADGSSAGNRGGWSALSAGTGAVRWQTPNPAYDRAMGPVSVANGVLYGCSMDPDGHMYALKASSGAVLWDFASGAACNGGAAISNGVVYWGTGYDAFTSAPDQDQALYAFAVTG